MSVQDIAAWIVIAAALWQLLELLLFPRACCGDCEKGFGKFPQTSNTCRPVAR